MSEMITFPAQPPRYWMEARKRAGISVEGAERIWYRIYDVQRRLIAWLAAPDEEWHEHKLSRP